MAERKSYEQLLMEYGSFIYPCSGNSMLPLLRPGRDVVEIHQKSEERCRKYDVVLYKKNNQYILHRVLKVQDKDYVIAGDHNYYLEYGITDEEILGVVRAIIRDGKRIDALNVWYILYSHLWCDLYHIRAGILYARTMIIKIKKKSQCWARH